MPHETPTPQDILVINPHTHITTSDHTGWIISQAAAAAAAPAAEAAVCCSHSGVHTSAFIQTFVHVAHKAKITLWADRQNK